MSESLVLEAVMEMARVCGLAAVLAERAAVRKSSGAILVAMTVLFFLPLGVFVCLLIQFTIECPRSGLARLESGSTSIVWEWSRSVYVSNFGRAAKHLT